MTEKRFDGPFTGLVPAYVQDLLIFASWAVTVAAVILYLKK